ncbi:hypothetical protein ACIBEJ_23015 [Nonomuraea sp. NPDC050790]|uniref:hypothetical protein n=1 Tax=Nonomuraea sp. NPDC050790 TaxID=3364371 RepID=UPI0037AA4EFB
MRAVLAGVLGLLLLSDPAMAQVRRGAAVPESGVRQAGEQTAGGVRMAAAGEEAAGGVRRAAVRGSGAWGDGVRPAAAGEMGAWASGVRPAAVGERGAPSGVVRFVSVKVCGERACGKVRVALRDGRTVEIGERPVMEGWGPIAVGGDAVAFFRARDRRLVVHRVGRKALVVGVKRFTEKVGADTTRLALSRDGRTLSYTSMEGDGPIRVYDTTTGKQVGRLPDGDVGELRGFSPDGDQAMMVYAGHRTVLYVHERGGRRLVKDVPPQLVAYNLPTGIAGDEHKAGALSADGRTVAVYVPGNRPRVALYDLAGRTVEEVPLARGFVPAAAFWTGPREVTFRVTAGRRTRLLAVSLDTGAVRTTDSYLGVDRTVHPDG